MPGSIQGAVGASSALPAGRPGQFDAMAFGLFALALAAQGGLASSLAPSPPEARYGLAMLLFFAPLGLLVLAAFAVDGLRPRLQVSGDRAYMPAPPLTLRALALLWPLGAVAAGLQLLAEGGGWLILGVLLIAVFGVIAGVGARNLVRPRPMLEMGFAGLDASGLAARLPWRDVTTLELGRIGALPVMRLYCADPGRFQLAARWRGCVALNLQAFSREEMNRLGELGLRHCHRARREIDAAEPAR